MHARSFPLAVAVTVTFSIVLPQPLLAAKTHSSRRAAKYISAERPFPHAAPGKTGTGGAPLDLSPEEMHDFGKSVKKAVNSLDLADQGDLEAKAKSWTQAQNYYQQALDLWPDNSAAVYGLGKCADAVGNTAGALNYYRKVVYTNNPHRYGTVPGDGYGTNDVTRLLEYVLLLVKAGQVKEALMVYHRTAYLLNYQDADTNGGKPYLDVLLPEVVVQRILPDQVRYTPKRLQAMVETAIAYGEMAFGSNKEALAHLRDAVKLYPDSPVTNYYLGEGLLGTNDPGAKAAYQRAVDLGNDRTIAAAKERIGMCR